MFFLARVLGGEVNIDAERVLSCSSGENLIFLQSCKAKLGAKSLGSRLLKVVHTGYEALPFFPGHVLTDTGGDRLLSATTGGSGSSHISSLLSTMDSFHGEG